MGNNTKKAIKISILVIIVLAGAFFYSFKKEKVTAFPFSDDYELSVTEATTLNITVEKEVFYGVGVKLTTEVKDAFVDIVVEIDGKTVASRNVRTDEISDGYTFLHFDKVKTTDKSVICVKMTTKSRGIYLTGQNWLQYEVRRFNIETMVVFILCMAYLFGLYKVLARLFRK